MACVVLSRCGWNPTVHLYSQARGQAALRRQPRRLRARRDPPAVRVAGAAAGTFDLRAVCRSGRAAARTRRVELGVAGSPARAAAGGRATDDARRRWYSAVARATTRTSSSTCSATPRWPTSLRATGAGLRSVEHVKRYTTIGTAHDQGKTSGVDRVGHHRRGAGRRHRFPWHDDVPAARTPRSRSPRSPAATAATTSTRCGSRRCTPGTSSTARCSRTSASGSARGTTRRAMRTSRPRCSASVRRRRTCVGMMDGSTLGKIDVQGADAGELLDRLYTNLMSTLKVGIDPVRRDVRHGRHGHRRRHRDAGVGRPSSCSPRPPATRPRSSTGWRSSSRPSGRARRHASPR